MLVFALAAASLAAWIGVLVLPSRPWSTLERLTERRAAPSSADLGRVAVLIPARNEAAVIAGTLAALSTQGRNLAVTLIDDESNDGTAEVARRVADAPGASLSLAVVHGQPVPPGWAGKLWALEQGLLHVDREYCLLLDADITLDPGVIGALLGKAEHERRAMVSVMASLHCRSLVEKLLVPAFIFFFKLLYPFAAVNLPKARTAAAAGGCILIRTSVLREVGGFSAWRDALIDDCTLATRVKRSGHSIWLGLSQHVRSERVYPDLETFRRMVSRTAFTQLRYSWLLLAAVALVMLIAFVMPWLCLLAGPDPAVRATGAVAILAMAAAYWPVVRFYRLSPLWAFSLSGAALLFLGMTIESAVSFARGTTAEWKGRTY